MAMTPDAGSPMTIAVTGGAGFVGSALCRRLIRQGDARVVVIDKFTYAASVEALEDLDASGRLHVERVDLCDRSALARVFARHRPQAVVHLAAETHVDRSIDGSATFLEANVVGTHHLLEVVRAYWHRLGPEARAAFRLLHVSTDEVFGSLGPTGKFTETSTYAPSSPYAASKAASDHLVQAWGRTYGLPVIVSHASNNYGPYQFPEKLIPLMITKALAGEPLPIYGTGTNVRDWLHVDDHAAALSAILQHGRPGATYNVGSETERSNLQVVEAICEALDALAPRAEGRPHASGIVFVTDRPGHDHRYAIDATKIRTEIGWHPAVPFETGLRTTVAWMVDNRPWWERIRASRYDGARLGMIGIGGL